MGRGGVNAGRRKSTQKAESHGVMTRGLQRTAARTAGHSTGEVYPPAVRVAKQRFCPVPPSALHFRPGMPTTTDSPLAAYLLALGWGSIVFGLWGWVGAWWVWPLGLGLGALVAGVVTFLAQVRLASRTAPPEGHP